jgi:Uma2 family endonuclease
VQTATQNEFVSVEDYLAAEEASDVRHEYLGGLVYAMAGETRCHNRIVGNLYSAIGSRLRSRSCAIYFSDIRVNLDLRNDEYYYYPDIVVTCDKRDTHARFVRYPKLIIEVLSESTERTDKREKFFAYTSIPSLEEYILVSQAGPELTVFRRANKWAAEKVSGLKSKVTFQSLKVCLPVSAIYEHAGT